MTIALYRQPRTKHNKMGNYGKSVVKANNGKMGKFIQLSRFTPDSQATASNGQGLSDAPRAIPWADGREVDRLVCSFSMVLLYQKTRENTIVQLHKYTIVQLHFFIYNIQLYNCTTIYCALLLTNHYILWYNHFIS